MAKEIKIEKQCDPRDIYISENNRNPEREAVENRIKIKTEELGNFLKAYADDVKRQETEQIRQKMEKSLLSEKEEQEIKDILHINKKEKYVAPECKVVEEYAIPGDFDGICRDLMALHARKNHDYGNAAHESYKEFGLVSYIIRLNDKMNRLKSLTKPGIAQKVTSESIEDTLMDLAAYAIMAIESLRS